LNRDRAQARDEGRTIVAPQDKVELRLIVDVAELSENKAGEPNVADAFGDD
jgi:hypothetical protein